MKKMKKMKKVYMKPEIEYRELNFGENIAASGKPEERYDVVIRRNGVEVVVEQGDFDSLPGLLGWLNEKFGH